MISSFFLSPSDKNFRLHFQLMVHFWPCINKAEMCFRSCRFFPKCVYIFQINCHISNAFCFIKIGSKMHCFRATAIWSITFLSETTCKIDSEEKYLKIWFFRPQLTSKGKIELMKHPLMTSDLEVYTFVLQRFHNQLQKIVANSGIESSHISGLK